MPKPIEVTLEAWLRAKGVSYRCWVTAIAVQNADGWDVGIGVQQGDVEVEMDDVWDVKLDRQFPKCSIDALKPQLITWITEASAARYGCTATEITLSKELWDQL